MTLNQIRSFVAVAHTGGFTAAARLLGMSHSTLNAQVQMLEREYGAELFHRSGRRVELSALGSEVLVYARRMIALESDMAAILDDSGKMRRGLLRIGAVGPYQVTEMIEAFHADYQRIKIHVTLGNSELVLGALDRYQSDVGVVASRFEDDKYCMQLYARYPVVIFVHKDHPFARRSCVRLEELAGQPLLMREPGSTTRKALEDALAAQDIKVQVLMEIGSREALREAVARGLGIGTVSQSEYVPDPRTRAVAIEGELVHTQIYVCCLKERRHSPLISAFFQSIQQHLAVDLPASFPQALAPR